MNVSLFPKQRRIFLAGELLGGLLLLLTLLPGGTLRAHPMPASAVMLDFHRDTVFAELILPLQDLEIGFGHPLLEHPEQILPQYGQAMKDYLIAHVRPVAPDGRPWTVAVLDLDVRAQVLPFDLVAHLRLAPPAGAPLRKFTLDYDVIIHEVVSHKSFIFVRNDWNDARFRSRDAVPPMPEAIGLIRYLVYSVKIDRTGGSFWRGFGSVLALGLRHVAGGLDHLLLLFVLLLPAPLRAENGRWMGFRGLKPSFVRLLKIVAAFTLGHSLALLIGGLGWLRLPLKPVEILIAAAILASAVHAIRPWFADKEPWVAGGIGLAHGLAFASSIIADSGFSPWHLAMTILGFNLGAGLMQLALSLAMMPALILLSRAGRCAPLVRIGGATLAALAAVFWIVARL